MILADYQFPTSMPDLNSTEKGWFRHALFGAYWSLRESTTYLEGIEKVIGLGGDTDPGMPVLQGRYWVHITVLIKCHKIHNS